jgi:hypothetical protein
MARIEIDPNYSSPTFSRATAGTDLFKKEDVQALAAAMSTHDHTTGKGAVLAAGSVTTAMLASNAVTQWNATIATAAATITSLSYVDMWNMQTTLTTTGGFILAWFAGMLSHDMNVGGMTVALRVDSEAEVSQIGVTLPSSGYGIAIALIGIFSPLTAASHTVGVRWKTNMGTAYITDRTLIIGEIKR